MLPSRQLQVGMSMLQLPVSRAKEEEVVNDSVSFAIPVTFFCLNDFISWISIFSLTAFRSSELDPSSHS
jgi:hypothetical protein